MNKSICSYISFRSLKRLWGSISAEYHQRIRFIVVGVWNTLFGFLLFCVLDTLFTRLFETRQIAYMSASLVGTIISILNAYIAHKKITFRSDVKGIKIIGEFLKFSATYAVTFCIGVILLPLLVEVGSLDPKLAAAIITLGCTVVSYVGHSKYSFKTKSPFL